MKTFTLILGDINFNLHDEPPYAIINKRDRILYYETAEDAMGVGERLISEGHHISYLIPELFKGTITDKTAETYLNKCRRMRTSRYIGKLMR